MKCSNLVSIVKLVKRAGARHLESVAPTIRAGRSVQCYYRAKLSARRPLSHVIRVLRYICTGFVEVFKNFVWQISTTIRTTFVPLRRYVALRRRVIGLPRPSLYQQITLRPKLLTDSEYAECNKLLNQQQAGKQH